MPYVPNHERIELGLEGFGSDVPEGVLNAAIARRDQLAADRALLEEVRPSRKRTRNPKGQLVADDPTTTENEAWES